MMLSVAAAALLSAGDLAAQQVDGAGWRSQAAIAFAAPDSRLRADFGAASQRWSLAPDARAARLSMPQLMLAGAAVGCAGGALVAAGGAASGERTAVGFNGCLVGMAAGMFLGGVYALATGR